MPEGFTALSTMPTAWRMFGGATMPQAQSLKTPGAARTTRRITFRKPSST
jgi:hypothetical protein